MFDSHAHYDDSAFDEVREELLLSLFNEHGVTNIINVGCDIQTSKNSLLLAEKFSFVYASVGIHPHEADNCTEETFDTVRSLLNHKKAVALGEIGLDYHYGNENREKQIFVFEKQLEMAKELDIPVIIHQRESVGDCLDCVCRHDVRGVFHSFSGSAETAKVLLDRGWYISFSGTVTFKNARNPVEVASIVPDDRILVETDCPYLTPHPHRGKRNDSGYMRLTLEKLAEIRGVDFEYMEKITAHNAKQLFGV